MNIQNLVRENIKSLQSYSSARDEFIGTSSKMIFIDANENPFDNGLNRYPDPQQIFLKDEISIIKGIEKSQLLLGNGSDEVLDLIFRVFCEPSKDAVITLTPTYGMYEVLAHTNDIKIINIPLSKDFQPNIQEILKSQNKETKVLFLCSPNNPTANSFDADTIEDLIINFEGIVVIDEAYIDFSKKESWLNRLNDFSNLIVIQTLSKAYGLAGIRLGICFASQEIISFLNKIKPPYNINQLTQEVALKVLKNSTKLYDDIETILLERQKLITSLNQLDFIEEVYPSDTNFILVKVDNAMIRYSQLINEGIVVRNRSNQPLCENCLRFTVGTKQENIKLIHILKQLEKDHF